MMDRPISTGVEFLLGGKYGEKRKKYKKSRKSGKKCLHFLLFFAKIITCDM